nr:hypothetical protein CFP56_57917 [Quercus suber]
MYSTKSSDGAEELNLAIGRPGADLGRQNVFVGEKRKQDISSSSVPHSCCGFDVSARIRRQHPDPSSQRMRMSISQPV